MGMNETPSGERVHIAFFGRRNAGKSSLVNAVTGQELAIVSDIRGTTTDPVYKSMELLPLGPVVIIDTPGIDDEGELGLKRVGKTRQVLNKADLAVLVVDAVEGISSWEEEMIRLFEKKEIPYLVVYNKMDLLTGKSEQEPVVEHTAYVSARTREGIQQLKEQMARLTSQETDEKRLAADLVKPFDTVILVVPIDKAAPKGRLILPQQQTIRDILDSDAVSVVVKENELKNVLQTLGRKPSLVITDSQVFAKVSADTPTDIPLTSFSILFARYKGNLDTLVNGARMLDRLQDGDTVLISEGCTHHRQCDDIGTVKLPRWIREHTGKQLNFEFTSGTEFPAALDRFRMIIHCGGCMLNEREMKYRIRCAEDAQIPITNYGTAIAYMQGILERSIQIFQR